MHSCDPLPPPPATGPSLLQELGRLIIRARSRSPSRQPRAAPADARERLLKAKLLAAKSLLPQPSTSQQVVQQQPRAEPGSPVEAQLDTHVHALWHEQIPICIEVQLAPDCPECFAKLSKMEEQSFDKAYDKSPKSSQERRGLLLERWTMTVVMKKTHEPSPHLISSQWLLSAVRSQLHFSQLGAWLARLKPKTEARHRGDEARHRGEDPGERRRKLSRESCNIKKLEANGAAEHCACAPPRRLNVLYSIGAPTERSQPPFDRAPAVHAFPNTDIGNNVHLCVVLESLPRTPEIPTLACLCAPKRRTSKDMSTSAHEDLASRIHDLTLGTSDGHRSHFTNDLGIINSNIGSSSGVTRRLSIFNNQENQDYPKTKENEATANETVLVDDRMHTLCSESGKHKCNCDDESSDQGKENPSSSKHHQQETKKLDERRLKEIAKYKRRLRKESKLRKLRDSTSESTGTSEGDGLNAKLKETHTSIPILQASRFDRFRAIGCYRNQTYLTLPASRIETKSPFLQEIIHPVEFTKTNTVSTQTEDISCDCGSKVFIKCDECKRGMKRSEANYNLTALNENEATKKPKCDNIINNNNILNINNKTCDINNLVVKEAKTSGIRKTPDDDEQTNIIKRPKLKKFLPLTDRIEKIVTDRKQSRQTDNDIEELLLKDDDSVFEYLSKNNQRQKPERQRQKNSSIGDDYVLYEKCYYGTFDRYDAESPKETTNGFVYPNDSKNHRKEKPEFQFQNPGFVSPNSQNHSSEKNGFQFPKPGYVYQKDSQNGHSEKPGFQFPTPEYDSQNHRSEKPGFQFPTPPPDAVSLDLTLQDYQSDSCTPNTPTYPDSENGFQYPNTQKDSQIPSPTEMDRFRWRFDSAASMVFHTKTGLPLTSSPAPLKRGNNCFDYDDSINGISGIKSALFHRHSPRAECASPAPPPPPRAPAAHRPNVGPSASLLGSFEESALKGRLEPVATVHGFTAELGASGAFCPPHRRLPVTVFFYAPGGTNAPYMGHINLGTHGYRVARSGTIQVSLFNPHGTLVKMFVVLYDLTAMPAAARTFLRQRTLYLPAGCKEPPAKEHHKYMRYLIHLRFMTSKSGKLYLHTDIRIIVSRKADMDTATAHSAIFNSISTNNNKAPSAPANHSAEKTEGKDESANRKPCRVFGGCSDFKDFELGYENQTGVSYELRSFTYGPENPKYSPR